MNLAERVLLLDKMDYQVSEIEDENAYMEWINQVPDGADMEVFLEIAGDLEDFHSVCVLFCKLMTKYCL